MCGDVGQGRKPHFHPETKVAYRFLLFSSNLIMAVMLVNYYFYFVINKINRRLRTDVIHEGLMRSMGMNLDASSRASILRCMGYALEDVNSSRAALYGPVFPIFLFYKYI
jgi:hypothetical protein